MTEQNQTTTQPTMTQQNTRWAFRDAIMTQQETRKALRDVMNMEAPELCIHDIWNEIGDDLNDFSPSYIETLRLHRFKAYIMRFAIANHMILDEAPDNECQEILPYAFKEFIIECINLDEPCHCKACKFAQSNPFYDYTNHKKHADIEKAVQEYTDWAMTGMIDKTIKSRTELEAIRNEVIRMQGLCTLLLEQYNISIESVND